MPWGYAIPIVIQAEVLKSIPYGAGIYGLDAYILAVHLTALGILHKALHLHLHLGGRDGVDAQGYRLTMDAASFGKPILNHGLIGFWPETEIVTAGDVFFGEQLGGGQHVGFDLELNPLAGLLVSGDALTQKT